MKSGYLPSIMNSQWSLGPGATAPGQINVVRGNWSNSPAKIVNVPGTWSHNLKLDLTALGHCDQDDPYVFYICDPNSC
jgi:hypothetical protein